MELAITAIHSEKAPIFTGVLRDITARKRADETRVRLAAIVDSSDDAIFSMGLDDTILTWNAGAERLYGYTASEVIGRSRTLLVPAGTTIELAAILDKAARGEAGRALRNAAHPEGRVAHRHFAHALADDRRRPGASPACPRSRGTSPTGKRPRPSSGA